MSKKVQQYRGLEKDLPRLEEGRLAFTTDTKKLFIGSNNGNVEITDKEEIENFNQQLERINHYLSDLIPPIFDEVGATIVVKKQSDCDNLTSVIRATNSQIINVAFSGGRYFVDQISLGSEFNNKTINFYNVSGEKVEIFPASDIYTPRDAIETTATHYICNIKNVYRGNNTIVTNNGAIDICDSRNIVGTVYRNAQDNVDIVDENSHLYRIKLPKELAHLENMNVSTYKSIFVWSTYHMFSAKITRVEDEFLYFTQNFTQNVNLDRTYLGIATRFYLTNLEEYLTDNTFMVKDNKIYIPKHSKYAIIANKSKCFDIKNTNARITINGLNFSGGYYDCNETYSPIIAIDNSSNISINACNFQNVESQVIYVSSSGNGSTSAYTTKNIQINHCNFENTGNGAIDFKGEDVTVTHCKFDYIAKFRKGAEVVYGAGKNFHVADNRVHYFPYVGIRVGKTRVESDYNSGIYERNIVNGGLGKHKDEFMADGGGIYVFTHNVDVTIQDNVVFNITGQDMRGIMGDDGNNNTKYIRNLVFNINGTGVRRGIDCFNDTQASQKNHLNNLYKNNIVLGATIVFRVTATSNTQTHENVVTHLSSYRNGTPIITKNDYPLNYYRTTEDCAYLNNKITLPFDIPDVFKDYLKFENPILMPTNRGNQPILLNNTDGEINQSNVVAWNLFSLQKYDMMNLNVHMVRGFQYSPLPLYSNLNIQIPWNLASMSSDCFINFKVHLYSQIQTFRTSFEVTYSLFKETQSTPYTNSVFEVTNVNPKANIRDIALKVTGYLDEEGCLSLLIEPLINDGSFFLSNTLTFIEVTDVKTTTKNPLSPYKGVVSINKTLAENANVFGRYAVLSGRATLANLKQTDVSYPDASIVYVTDTNQLVMRRNNKWYVQSTTELQ